jgi:hypothetical protein
MTGRLVTTADAIALAVEGDDKPTLELTGYLTAALCLRAGNRLFRGLSVKKDENSELLFTIQYFIQSYLSSYSTFRDFTVKPSNIMVHGTSSHHRPLLITHTPKLPKLSPLSYLYVYRVGNVDDRPTSFPLAALSLPCRGYRLR